MVIVVLALIAVLFIVAINFDYDLRKHRNDRDSWRFMEPDAMDLKRKIAKNGYRIKWGGK